MKKALASLVLAGSIAMVGTAPAMAVDGYSGEDEQGQVQNQDGDFNVGEQFAFSGEGFLPNEQVNVQVEQTGGPQANGGGFSGGASLAVAAKITLPLAPQTFTTQADANGRFSIPVTVSEAGTYVLTATGVTSGHTVSATVTVKAASLANAGGGASLANSGGAAGLANTGADSGLVLWTLVGAGALAAGAASVVVVRRRAKSEAAA
jgi:LPXTG-motif cell wall-anchored protein